MPRVVAHTHKLKRHRYKTTGSSVFFCTLPDCHFKIDLPLALGKKNLCWRCGKEHTLNEYSLRLAKPHCDACKKEKIPNKVVIPIVEPSIKDASKELKDRLETALRSPFAAVPDEREI